MPTIIDVPVQEVRQAQNAVAAAEKKVGPIAQEIQQLKRQRNQQQKVIDNQTAQPLR